MIGNMTVSVQAVIAFGISMISAYCAGRIPQESIWHDVAMVVLTFAFIIGVSL